MGRSFIAAGHNVDFIPTDKDIYFPKDLNPYLKQAPYGNYDIQISYTQPGNWKEYFKYSGKKFAIWNFEYQLAQGSPGLLLPGFGKNHVHVDMIFPSSQFSKKVFMDMGVPESKLIVIPHGVDVEKFQTKEKWTLKTKKSKKILLNIMQPHTRKNIPAALEVYGRAFTNKDDVCLVCKVFVKNKKNNQFDVDFYKLLSDFKKKYKNHGEVEVVTEFIPNIAHLYNAVDVHFSATHCECFFYPAAEAMCAGIVNIVPNYSGHLDFCNDQNSLLIDVKLTKAPKKDQYWIYNSFAIHSDINIDDAVSKLKYAVDKNDELKQKFKPGMDSVKKTYTWDSVVKSIVGV